MKPRRAAGGIIGKTCIPLLLPIFYSHYTHWQASQNPSSNAENVAENLSELKADKNFTKVFCLQCV